MYEQFFGLNRPPFKITPDTSLFYDGGRRGDVLGALVYAVQRGEGIVKVVGEVGSGKTMLCRMLQKELPQSVEIIYIANPSVSPDDILFVIAHELKLDVKKESSKHEVMHLLQNHLLSRFAGDRQVVLFVEEAQGMPLETLEEIRLLSNLETEQDKLLQIILFGQPELDDNLKITSIRQLRERITHEFNLTPLTDDEIHSYLNFRMREVGYTGPELIDRSTAKVIGKYSGGLLRRINIIADKVLLSAFAGSTHNITKKHVQAAVKDSGFDRSVKGGLSINHMLLALLLVIVLALAAWFGWQMSKDVEQVASSDHAEVIEKEIQKSAPKAEPPVEPIELAVQSQVNQALAEKDADVQPIKTDMKLQSELAALEDKAEQDRLLEAINRKKKNSNLLIVEETTAEKPQVQAVEVEKESKNTLNSEEMALVLEDYNKSAENSLSISSDNTNIEGTIAQNKSKILSFDNEQWLSQKLKSSKEWLKSRKDKGVSIQVLMRNKAASNELVDFLRLDWPLSVEQTYLYEVEMNERKIYRVFYGEYQSLSEGLKNLDELPESVKKNGPYLHSIYRMKENLL